SLTWMRLWPQSFGAALARRELSRRQNLRWCSAPSVKLAYSSASARWHASWTSHRPLLSIYSAHTFRPSHMEALDAQVPRLAFRIPRRLRSDGGAHGGSRHLRRALPRAESGAVHLDSVGHVPGAGPDLGRGQPAELAV